MSWPIGPSTASNAVNGLKSLLATPPKDITAQLSLRFSQKTRVRAGLCVSRTTSPKPQQPPDSFEVNELRREDGRTD